VKIVFRWTAHLSEPPGLALIPQAFFQIPGFGAPNRLFFRQALSKCLSNPQNVFNGATFQRRTSTLFEACDISAPDHRFFSTGISVGEKSAYRKKSEFRRCRKCLSIKTWVSADKFYKFPKKDGVRRSQKLAAENNSQFRAPNSGI